MKFSKKVIVVYSSIVVIPLILLLSVITNLNSKSQYFLLYQECEKANRTNAAHIASVGESFTLIKKMVDANSKLLLYFILPDAKAEDFIIDTIISETSAIEQLLSVTPYIYSVRIFSNNPELPERWPVFLKADRTNVSELKKWEFDYIADYMGFQEPLMAPSFSSTRKISYGSRDAGYLQITMKMEDAFPFIYEKSDRFQNDYLFYRTDSSASYIPFENEKIISIQNKVPSFVVEKINSLEISETSKDRSGNFVYSEDGHKNYVTWTEIPEMDLLTVHICSLEIIDHDIRRLLFIMTAVLFISIVIFYLVITFTSERLMAGVYSLMDGMKKVKSGDFSVKIPVLHNDEVGDTQIVFNSMTEQLTNQIEQIKNEQSLIADTEMKAMQNQINAHFLYNVLETIRMQAELADQEDISESITVLGKMMRYCLRWRVHRVTIEQEVEYVRSYAYILNIRNDYIISLQTEIPPEFYDIEIPKMILQPIVENAFNYAVEPLGKDAVIRIYAEKKGDRLELSVQDFGPGMSEDTLNRLNCYLMDDKFERDSKGSIGLKNIQQRLTMFYGNDYRVKIKSEPGKGTIITVPIPFVFMQEGN